MTSPSPLPSRQYPPLPERLRPDSLDRYVGQRHLVGSGSVLRRMIEAGTMGSFILWGPPGVGKTTLAHIIAETLGRQFFTLSAVSSGVKDVREVFEKAREASLFNQGGGTPILFIDEIHRFNKAQQDALLGAVENGTIVLIGATTENPSFEVISPLLSRCQVFVLKPLEKEDLELLVERAVREDVLLRELPIRVAHTAALLRVGGGDARRTLNALELTVESQRGQEEILIDDAHVLEAVQQNMAVYDKDGEMHFDLISAFIKSIRGSDPNAAVYYLARMLEGGEDPLFIARRLCLSASEDVGLANPNALLLANACFDVVSKIGMPEGRIPLAEATVYLAASPKSNASYLAVEEALAKVRETGDLPVPLPIRNAPTALMEKLGYGDGYKYAHDFPGHFADMEFLPDAIQGTVFYRPQPNRHEDPLRAYLEACWPKYYGKGKA